MIRPRTLHVIVLLAALSLSSWTGHARQKEQARFIHVVVALCDNEYQGIVPVPARIGNGDDPANNLYWGAAYGIRSYFKKDRDWEHFATLTDLPTGVLERQVFKRKGAEVYMFADAYRGREIKRSTIDFLEFAAGRKGTMMAVDRGPELKAGGNADLVVYIGHDGLMDFTLPSYPKPANNQRRDAIILACISKRYFAEPLRSTGAHPLLWTTGLMAPEAYVLDAALDGWIVREDGEKIRARAAKAYNRYQRCGMKGAMRLFATGW